MEPYLEQSVSSLRRGHANLLCIVPILAYGPKTEGRGAPRARKGTARPGSRVMGGGPVRSSARLRLSAPAPAPHPAAAGSPPPSPLYERQQQIRSCEAADACHHPPGLTRSAACTLPDRRPVVPHTQAGAHPPACGRFGPTRRAAHPLALSEHAWRLASQCDQGASSGSTAAPQSPALG